MHPVWHLWPVCSLIRRSVTRILKGGASLHSSVAFRSVDCDSSLCVCCRRAVRRSPNTRNVPKENASVIPFLQWPASDGAAFEWGALHASRRGPWISLGTPPARPRVHFLNQGTSPSPDRLNDDRQRCLRLICLIKHRRRDSRLGAPCSRPPRYLVSLPLTTFRNSRLLPVCEDGTTGQGREGGEE